MPRTRFEQLRVYQYAEEIADEIWNIVCKWDTFARDTVGKQVVRSADSIGANIAEGEGRGSYQDNRRFIRIARGSLQETQHWLRRAYKRGLLTEEQVELLKPLISRLAPTLNAYLRSIGMAKPTTAEGPMANDQGLEE
ncbi:MAG: four helix bundle protein [Acidobacteria bacterium]|nr:four helix bundle protein [Acidobacteriota bacterium]